MKILLESWRKYLEEGGQDVARDAFQNTDPDYLKKSVEQRNPGPAAAGSIFLQQTSVEDLMSAAWSPYNHPDIQRPAIGFKAPIPGILGIAKAKTLPLDQLVRFQPAHGGKVTVKDEKSPKFGQQLAEVVTPIPGTNRKVAHTTLILGPSKEDPNKLTMWTFFPGDPTPKFPDITMDDIRKKFNSDEETISATVADAIKLNYNFVKHVDKL